MSNIDNIIADIKEVQMTYDFWIRDGNGDLKDDVICAEIIPILEELKQYEVDASQEKIEECFREAYNSGIGKSNNSYNWSAPIDHDFDYTIIKDDVDGILNGILFIFSVHRYGDIRGNYTDYAMCQFDDELELYTLDSMCQSKRIVGTPFIADINVLSETYDIYDCEADITMYGFYDLEVKDLLTSINENRLKFDFGF